MKQKLAVAERRGFSHNYVMAKRVSYFILALSLTCSIAFGGKGINLALMEPDGAAETAEWDSDGFFRNQEKSDARYIVPINHEKEGSILRITAEVSLNPSNVVSVCFGDLISDALLLECREGNWEIRCGRQRHRFDAPVPPLQTGTHTYRIHFATCETGRMGGYSPEVKISVDGGKESYTNGIAPSLSQWKGMGDPTLWTHARIALRGKGAGIRNADIDYGNPGTLIIIR